MEIVSAVISIVSCLWGPTNLRKCYIINLQENLDLLKEAMDDLKSIRNDVKSKVDAAEQKLLKCTDQVQRWLQKVETTERQVNGMEVEFRQMARCFGNCRPNGWSGYKLGKKVAKMLKDVAVLKIKGESFSEVAYKPLPDAIEEMASTSAVGMDLMFQKVLSWLSEDEVGIIGIFGMGGIGKTTLLKKINNEFLEITNEFDFVIWVVVSKELNVEKIQNDIGKRLGLSWPENESNYQTRARDIRKVLSRKKFMLLLDDIWEKLDLDMVGIPHPSKRKNMSKIIFTTRSEDICYRMSANKKVRVECLMEQEAWDLFRWNVGEEAMNSHPEIPILAKHVAKECKGLPLALITIGRAMACKKTPLEWKHAISVLSMSKPPSEISGMDDDDDMILHLKFSYDNLGGEQIKSCFLYCSLFPEDYSIGEEELIDYWIGEGFLDGWDDDLDKARNRGHNVIGILKVACLLESGSYGIKTVKLHDVIRDMALWIASEGGKKKRYLVKAGVGLRHAPAVKRWKEAERISLMDNNIEELTKIPQCPNLLTLMLQRNAYFKRVHTDFFQFMPLLRVLDLSHSFMFKELPAGIGNLAELRYLNLSHTDIISLPEEMRNLVKLQHLNLQHSFLQELPAGIGSLVELRYLNPSATRIRSLPEEMRNLVKLQHLNLRHSFLQELPVGFGNLAELRYLNLSGTGITSLPEEMKNLVKMQHLEFQSSCLQELPAGIGDLAELQYLNLSNTWIRSLPEEIGNLVKLKHLDLRTVFLDRIPQGAISRLSELRVMKLYNSMWEEGSEGFNISELESLEHLIHLDLTVSTVHDLERLLGSSKLRKVTRFLQLEGCEGLTTSIQLSYLFTEIRHISIEKCNMLEEVTIGADGESYDDYPVSSLEYLHLRNNSGLNCIRVGCGCFENLGSISIEHCYKLKKIDSLLQLESLEKIEISNCYELEEVISRIADDDDDDDDDEVGDKGLMQLSFISLKNVPELTSICSDALHFPSLEVMEVSACPKLKKLPLSLIHSAYNSLREIRGAKEWWDGLEWEDDSIKSYFLPFFKEY